MEPRLVRKYLIVKAPSGLSHLGDASCNTYSKHFSLVYLRQVGGLVIFPDTFYQVGQFCQVQVR